VQIQACILVVFIPNYCSLLNVLQQQNKLSKNKVRNSAMSVLTISAAMTMHEQQQEEAIIASSIPTSTPLTATISAVPIAEQLYNNFYRHASNRQVTRELLELFNTYDSSPFSIADINNFERNGDFLIHTAAYHGNLELVQFCIEKCGENINKRTNNEQRETPLMLAMCKGTVHVIEYMLSMGANPFISDNPFHYTALDYAVFSSTRASESIIMMLMKRRGNLPKCFKNRNHTSATMAAKYGNWSKFMKMLRTGQLTMEELNTCATIAIAQGQALIYEEIVTKYGIQANYNTSIPNVPVNEQFKKLKDSFNSTPLMIRTSNSQIKQISTFRDTREKNIKQFSRVIQRIVAEGKLVEGQVEILVEDKEDNATTTTNTANTTPTPTSNPYVVLKWVLISDKHIEMLDKATDSKPVQVRIIEAPIAIWQALHKKYRDIIITTIDSQIKDE